MKKLLLLSLAGALTVACSNEQTESVPVASPRSPVVSVSPGGRLSGKLNISSIAKLTKVDLASNLKVSLYTADGRLIEKTSELRPNTEYKVVVDGSRDAQIRACFGFDLLNQAEQADQGKLTNSFTIRTHSDVLESPIISIVPLRRVGSTMFREQAQTISLTK